MGVGEQELKKLMDGRDNPPARIVIKMGKKGGHRLLVTIDLAGLSVQVQRRTPRYGVKDIEMVPLDAFSAAQDEFFRKWEDAGYAYDSVEAQDDQGVA